MKTVTDEQKMINAIMKDDASIAQETLEKIIQKKCFKKIKQTLDKQK